MELPTLGQLIDATKMASLVIAERFAQPHNVEHKDDGTPVTPTDIEVNRQLGNYAKLWKIGFLGEEGNGAEDTEDHLFVDSLDGTGAYARGMATATTIISHMHCGVPITAVIHNPITKQTWAATKGGGSWYAMGHTTLTRTHVAENPPKRWRTAICVWPGADKRVIDFQQQVLESADFSDQQMGAIGLGGGLIASGTLHATAYGATSAVETAAMSLIVREAGGVAIDLLGNPLERFELGQHKGKTDFLLPHGAIIACNKEVANALLALY